MYIESGIVHSIIYTPFIVIKKNQKCGRVVVNLGPDIFIISSVDKEQRERLLSRFSSDSTNMTTPSHVVYAGSTLLQPVAETLSLPIDQVRISKCGHHQLTCQVVLKIST